MKTTLILITLVLMLAGSFLFLHNRTDPRVDAYAAKAQEGRDADQRALDTIETYGKRAESGDKDAMWKIWDACQETSIPWGDIDARYQRARARLDADADAALAAEMMRK